MPQIECRPTLVRTVNEVLAVVSQLRNNYVRNLAHVLPFLKSALGLGGVEPTLGQCYETTTPDIVWQVVDALGFVVLKKLTASLVGYAVALGEPVVDFAQTLDDRRVLSQIVDTDGVKRIVEQGF